MLFLPLSAAAGLDNHLGEGLQHEAVVVIREEDGEALHLTGHAARLRQLQSLLALQDAKHGGVVGRVFSLKIQIILYSIRKLCFASN